MIELSGIGKLLEALHFIAVSYKNRLLIDCYKAILFSVKRNSVIHFLLILALSVGQSVANVHVLGHLHTTDLLVDSQSTPFDAHSHEHLNLAESDSSSSENDCAVYHAYAGIYGITSADCKAIALRLKPLIVTERHQLFVAVRSKDSQPIRGPPKQA